MVTRLFNVVAELHIKDKTSIYGAKEGSGKTAPFLITIT